MLVLVIDTAGQTGSVLLARNESASFESGKTEVLGTGVLQPREFSTQLIAAVAELLQASQLKLADVDAFAVVSGPGSFTGLRVGLSTVKALAEGTGKPVIALSQLAIMASAAEACWPGLAADGMTADGMAADGMAADGMTAAVGVVHVVLDAGRGEFYHGIYRNAGKTCVAESLESLEDMADAFNQAPGLVVASEPNVLAALSVLPGVAPRRIEDVTVREALPLVFAAWRARRFSDVALLDANYLRRINPALASKATSGLKPADTRADR